MTGEVQKRFIDQKGIRRVEVAFQRQQLTGWINGLRQDGQVMIVAGLTRIGRRKSPVTFWDITLVTDRRIRRGTFGSVRELESAIRDYLAHHNEIPNRSSGLPMPTQSSKRSSVFVYELLTQDTS